MRCMKKKSKIFFCSKKIHYIKCVIIFFVHIFWCFSLPCLNVMFVCLCVALTLLGARRGNHSDHDTVMKPLD